MPKRKRKNPAAVALGRLGGRARAQTVLEAIPAEKRREYARQAVNARWAKYRARKKAKDGT